MLVADFERNFGFLREVDRYPFTRKRGPPQFWRKDWLLFAKLEFAKFALATRLNNSPGFDPSDDVGATCCTALYLYRRLCRLFRVAMDLLYWSSADRKFDRWNKCL